MTFSLLPRDQINGGIESLTKPIKLVHNSGVTLTFGIGIVQMINDELSEYFIKNSRSFKNLLTAFVSVSFCA